MWGPQSTVSDNGQEWWLLEIDSEVSPVSYKTFFLVTEGFLYLFQLEEVSTPFNLSSSSRPQAEWLFWFYSWYLIRKLFHWEHLSCLIGRFLYSIWTTLGDFCLVGVFLPSCSFFRGILGLPAAFRPVWGLEEPPAILRWSSGLFEALGFAGVNKESMIFSDLRPSKPQK